MDEFSYWNERAAAALSDADKAADHTAAEWLRRLASAYLGAIAETHEKDILEGAVPSRPMAKRRSPKPPFHFAPKCSGVLGPLPQKPLSLTSYDDR
jgi:hypothetical protein